jgi:hypothetical protein
VSENRRRRALLLVVISGAFFACRGILGIGDGALAPDSDAAAEGGAGDGSADDGAALGDGALSAPPDGGSTSPLDAGVTKEAGKPVDDSGALDWAAWLLPATSPGAANYTSDTDTVTDKTTGLMWERGFSAKVVYANAPDHCITLTAGGYNDWRMPTWIELFSIVDFGAKNPAIETTAFPATPSEYFWSSTINARTSLPLGVFFFNGAMTSLPTGGNQLQRVRCVRHP